MGQGSGSVLSHVTGRLQRVSEQEDVVSPDATLAKFNVRDVSVLVANIKAYIHQLSEEGCTDTDRHRPLLHDLIKDYVPHRVKSTTHVTLDDEDRDIPLVETLTSGEASQAQRSPWFGDQG